MAFSDHYEFNSSVLEGVMREAEKTGAEYVVVTSKDWVKIRPFMSDNKKVIESWYEHQIENEGEFIKCCM
jgi:tetraacyldisaccharide-1-P 4'-kinase